MPPRESRNEMTQKIQDFRRSMVTNLEYLLRIFSVVPDELSRRIRENKLKRSSSFISNISNSPLDDFPAVDIRTFHPVHRCRGVEAAVVASVAIFSPASQAEFTRKWKMFIQRRMGAHSFLMLLHPFLTKDCTYTFILHRQICPMRKGSRENILSICETSTLIKVA